MTYEEVIEVISLMNSVSKDDIELGERMLFQMDVSSEDAVFMLNNNSTEYYFTLEDGRIKRTPRIQEQ